MRKLSEITESIWSDMQDRSSGETVRKEDDVNLLDRDGFYDYLVEHYECLYPESYMILNLKSSDMLIIPMLKLLKSQNEITFNLIIWDIDKPGETFITIPDEIPFKSSNLLIKLRDKYKLIPYGNMLSKFKIEPKSEKDDINKSFFISIIDTILELNTEYEPLIKRNKYEKIK